jgi:hypothetical protein
MTNPLDVLDQGNQLLAANDGKRNCTENEIERASMA